MEKPPYSATWARINSEFLSSGDWARAVAERTAYVDQATVEAARELLLPAAEPGVAVLAVGGYGRRQLFPYSDVDLLLLFASEKLAQAAREPISAFLQSLWDAGLRVSHSVRTPEECLTLNERNVELTVSLLDQRYLTGDRSLYAQVADRLPRFVRGQRDALGSHLCRMARERHAKYDSTYCHLEPNIKETPGGMRDYQLRAWLEQIRGSDPEPSREMRQAWSFLARLRCSLHCGAGRDNNALTFDAQESAAEQWAGGDAAAWMREYFRHARTVYQGALQSVEAAEGQTSGLLTSFRDWRARLSNADFSVSRERVHFRVPQQLEPDPDLLLRLFQFVARHGVRPSLETSRRIAERLPRLEEHFAQSRPLWPALSEIFTLPHAPVALRSMHETGALRVFLPEFERIECLVVRDFFHRYTVDEHTLVAVRNLVELRAAEEKFRKPFADLLSELEQPGLLVFALLFHDTGKAHPAGGHVEGSVEAAEAAMARIQMPPHDRKAVRFLIRKHLAMSAALQSRDLFDPATARYMAETAETVEGLKALTLLSYADVSAVNPTVMTPWRSGQLFQLYLLTYNELTRELDTERIGSEAVSAPFLEGFPKRYLRTHSEDEMRRHVQLEQASRGRGIAVEIEKLPAAWRLTLVARDRPFLFASVAGTLSAFGMNILKAEAFGNRQGTVLDTFTFSDPMRNLELNPSEVDRLHTTVERVLLGRNDVRQLLRNRPRPVPPSRKASVKRAVSFDNEASGAATLIQVVAEDRPGLLYDLASAISEQGCSIDVVLIDTEAHKAIDVFYVTSAGGKLRPEQQETLGAALWRVIGGLEERPRRSA